MSDSFSFTYGEPTLPIDSPPSAEPTKLAFFSGMHHFKTHPYLMKPSKGLAQRLSPTANPIAKKVIMEQLSNGIFKQS